MAITSNDLKTTPYASGHLGGLINEDVMQSIWDISRIPLPLTDLIGSDSVGNAYAEWTEDVLADPATDNAVIDGADITQDDTKVGERLGNHAQTSVKRVQVSHRARESNGIGYADRLSYEVMMRQRELRRDVEAQMSTEQASVKDDGSTTAGVSGALGAWIGRAADGGTNADLPSGRTQTGFDSTTGLVVAPSGTYSARAMTETMVRTVAEGVYKFGGESRYLMSTPEMIRQFSNYLFTSSARVAALQSDVVQQASAVTATGAVNVFVSDFSTLSFVPNRLQQPNGANDVNVYLLDPDYLRIGYLYGYRTEPLAKTGLSDVRMMSVDYTLKVLNQRAQGIIANVDPSQAVTL